MGFHDDGTVASSPRGCVRGYQHACRPARNHFLKATVAAGRGHCDRPSSGGRHGHAGPSSGHDPGPAACRASPCDRPSSGGRHDHAGPSSGNDLGPAACRASPCDRPSSGGRHDHAGPSSGNDLGPAACRVSPCDRPSTGVCRAARCHGHHDHAGPSSGHDPGPACCGVCAAAGLCATVCRPGVRVSRGRPGRRRVGCVPEVRAGRRRRVRPSTEACRGVRPRVRQSAPCVGGRPARPVWRRRPPGRPYTIRPRQPRRPAPHIL